MNIIINHLVSSESNLMRSPKFLELLVNYVDLVALKGFELYFS
jgi:hypothetical protein